MKRAGIMLAIVGAVLQAGCMTHPYAWSEYPLEPGRVPFARLAAPAGAIEVVNEQADATPVTLGDLNGVHTYTGSLRDFSDGVVRQLSKELAARNVPVAAGAAKSIRVKVTAARFSQGGVGIIAHLETTVRLGSGYEKTVLIDNRSASVPSGLNGAVALTILRCFEDPEIAAYFRK